MNIVTKLKNIRKDGQRIYNDMADDKLLDIWLRVGRNQEVCSLCKELGIWCKTFCELNEFLRTNKHSPRAVARIAKAAKKNDKLAVLIDMHLTDLRDVRFI